MLFPERVATMREAIVMAVPPKEDTRREQIFFFVSSSAFRLSLSVHGDILAIVSFLQSK